MIWLGILLFVFDFITPFLPFGSLIFLFVTIWKPKWFKRLVDEIYGGVK